MVVKTLAEIKTQLDTKSVDGLKCGDGYQTGIYCDKITAQRQTKPSKEILAEMDEFVIANGLEAKDYRIYQGLGFGLTCEESIERYLDLQKKLHPVILKNRV